MKGEKTITLEGEKVKLRFTLGVLEDVQDYLKEKGVEGGIDSALSEMKHLRFFLAKLAEYGGNKVDADEFKKLDFSEMENAISIISEATEGLPAGKGKKEK